MIVTKRNRNKLPKKDFESVEKDTSKNVDWDKSEKKKLSKKWREREKNKKAWMWEKQVDEE